MLEAVDLRRVRRGAARRRRRRVAGVRGVWSGYVGLRHVQGGERRAEARSWPTRRSQLQEQRALADRSRGLEQLLELRDQLDARDRRRPRSSAAARRPISGPSRSTRARATACEPTWPSSRRPASSAASSCRALRAAKVQLLIDRNAAAGALVERSRAQGVVVGAGDDRLRLDYVSEVVRRRRRRRRW